MQNYRTRCWDEDALVAVSIALYLCLAFGAVHTWANQSSRAVSQLLYPVKTVHTLASPCRSSL